MDFESQIAAHATEIDQVSCEANQILYRPIVFDSIAWFTSDNTNLKLNFSKEKILTDLARYSILFPKIEIKFNQSFKCCTLLDNNQVNCQMFLATTIKESGL